MIITKQSLKIHIYPSGNCYISWLKNDKFHREDGPAEVWNDEDEYYYLKSIFYSKDGYWKEVHENY